MSRETREAVGRGGAEEQKPLTTLPSLKPFPHDAPTQLPQSGTPGAIPVRQVRHQVQVQAPALSLRRHCLVSMSPGSWQQGGVHVARCGVGSSSAGACITMATAEWYRSVARPASSEQGVRRLRGRGHVCRWTTQPPPPSLSALVVPTAH